MPFRLEIYKSARQRKIEAEKKDAEHAAAIAKCTAQVAGKSPPVVPPELIPTSPPTPAVAAAAARFPGSDVVRNSILAAASACERELKKRGFFKPSQENRFKSRRKNSVVRSKWRTKPEHGEGAAASSAEGPVRQGGDEPTCPSPSAAAVSEPANRASWRKPPPTSATTSAAKLYPVRAIVSGRKEPGGIFDIRGRCDYDSTPDQMYNVLTDYENNSRLFRVVEAVEAKQLGRGKVELTQTVRWNFMFLTGTFDVKLEVHELPSTRTLVFRQKKPGFMKLFQGRWVVWENERDPSKSTLTLQQRIKPTIMPPPPISTYALGIMKKSLADTFADLNRAVNTPRLITKEVRQVRMAAAPPKEAKEARDADLDEDMAGFDDTPWGGGLGGSRPSKLVPVEETPPGPLQSVAGLLSKPPLPHYPKG